MKIIFPLLALFAIGCVLYGISAGVQAIGRGLSRLADAASGDDVPATPPLTTRQLRAAAKAASASAAAPPQPALPEQPAQPAQTSAAAASPMQRSITELRDIFALYQQGALTQEEFERMKQRLLNSINTAAPQNH